MDSFAPSPSLESCEVSSLVQRVRQFFAPPPVELPRHIAERDARRCECACRLLDHLSGPDGLNLSGLNLGRIARALGIKYKHAVRALADLGRAGVFAGRTVTLFGNGCGHDPERPRWFSQPGHHKRHPKIIDRVILELRAYYSDPRATLPGLNYARPFTGTKQDRQRRSERREACCSLLAAMLQFTDLVTLRVGKPKKDGGFEGIAMGSKTTTLPDGRQFHTAGLAELAGISLSRAEEAMHDLVAAGIVRVHEICEKLDDLTYKGFAAIRTISPRLFQAFGLDLWLSHERRRAKERFEKRMDKHNRKNRAKVQMVMNKEFEDKLNALREQQKADAAGIEPPKKTGGLTPIAKLCLDQMRQTLGIKPKYNTEPDSS